MKKELDEIDFELLKNAVTLCSPGRHQPGARMRQVYRSLLRERCDSFLWGRMYVLAAEGYLSLERISRTHIMVKPTPKARRLVGHNGPEDGELSE